MGMETQNNLPAEPTQTSKLAGRYLTFILNEEYYGVEILKVREIIGMQSITHVPDTEPCLKGAINLRGQVIAVIDLRLKLSMAEKAYQEETCIIIIDTGATITGVIVDQVDEVTDLDAQAIEPPPRFADPQLTSYLLGMGKTKGRVILLLDSAALLDPLVNTGGAE
jgi:purine-binding chemotaxis protein CheW